jgi:predicted RNase H-like nuclease (RuvC/YqgF family)
MDGHVLAEILAAIGVIFGSGLAAWLTSRAANRATETTAAVSEAAVEVDREDRLIQNLERRLNAVEAENESLRTRVTRCDEHNADNRARVRALADQVRELRRESNEAHVVIEGLRAYAVTLRNQIEDLGHPVPPPPKGLILDE